MISQLILAWPANLVSDAQQCLTSKAAYRSEPYCLRWPASLALRPPGQSRACPAGLSRDGRSRRRGAPALGVGAAVTVCWGCLAALRPGWLVMSATSRSGSIKLASGWRCPAAVYGVKWVGEAVGACRGARCRAAVICPGG
jgi:hypothetical protein